LKSCPDMQAHTPQKSVYCRLSSIFLEQLHNQAKSQIGIASTSHLAGASCDPLWPIQWAKSSGCMTKNWLYGTILMFV
jgi:hypothetical protein